MLASSFSVYDFEHARGALTEQTPTDPNIYARDGNRCQYCGKKFSTTELSLDHVLPKTGSKQVTVLFLRD